MVRRSPRKRRPKELDDTVTKTHGSRKPALQRAEAQPAASRRIGAPAAHSPPHLAVSVDVDELAARTVRELLEDGYEQEVMACCIHLQGEQA